MRSKVLTPSTRIRSVATRCPSRIDRVGLRIGMKRRYRRDGRASLLVLLGSALGFVAHLFWRRRLADVTKNSLAPDAREAELLTKEDTAGANVRALKR